MTLASLHSLTIPGEPVAQGRPRFARVGDGVRTYDPPRSLAWKHAARYELRAQWRQPPLEGPVSMVVDAYFARPKRIKKPYGRVPKVTRPDAENVAKAILDAATGELYADDAQVVELVVRKWYSGTGQRPRVELLVGPWEGER